MVCDMICNYCWMSVKPKKEKKITTKSEAKLYMEKRTLQYGIDIELYEWILQVQCGICVSMSEAVVSSSISSLYCLLRMRNFPFMLMNSGVKLVYMCVQRPPSNHYSCLLYAVVKIISQLPNNPIATSGTTKHSQFALSFITKPYILSMCNDYIKQQQYALILQKC